MAEKKVYSSNWNIPVVALRSGFQPAMNGRSVLPIRFERYPGVAGIE